MYIHGLNLGKYTTAIDFYGDFIEPSRYTLTATNSSGSTSTSLTFQVGHFGGGHTVDGRNPAPVER